MTWHENNCEKAWKEKFMIKENSFSESFYLFIIIPSHYVQHVRLEVPELEVGRVEGGFDGT